MPLSVRVRAGDTVDTLSHGLKESRVAVAHPARAFTARSFQAALHVLFRRCEDVSVIGAFDIEPYETLPIAVQGAVSDVTVVDSDENGSLRGGTRVLVFGNLKQLTKLVLKCHCEVHLLGDLEAHTELCITAAALRVNGTLVPGVGGGDELFQWYRVPHMMACTTVRTGQTQQDVALQPPRVFTF